MSQNRPAIVSPEWLDERIGAATIVDVRDERTYAEVGHIPGAVNVPAERFRDPSTVGPGMLPGAEPFAELLGTVGIDSDETVVAYDDEGGPLAARLLLTALTYGHRGELYLLDGGFDAWRESSPLSNEEPVVELTEYHVHRPFPNDVDASTDTGSPLVDREDVEHAVESDTVIVDTRTRVEYEQSHVPSAVQLDWESFLDDDRRLKSTAELETILADRGISPDRPLILYCNTARRLSHTYVVLRHLGYDTVGFYEGSLTDWLRANSPDWDPLELRSQVRAYADRGFDALVADLGDDVINRLKLVGLYHQKQRGYFMLRTKVPGGWLTSEQAQVIGTVADEFARAPEEYGATTQNPIFGDGYLDVTTRQDVQMHWIRLADVPEIWDRYEAVGLTTLQACGNSVRNVVSCPAAGIDANETIDVRPQVQEISDRFLGDRVYGNLPRKLKVSLTGCHENCARAQINDLAFTPAVKDGRDGFAVRVGGGLSDGPRMASDLGIFVESDQLSDLVAATAEVFKNNGSYLDTAVNRLRFLVEELGVDRFRDELERAAPFEFESAGEELTTDYRGDHVGVHEQDDGRYYVGLAVPVGRMAGHEFVALADISGEYGDDELRLTPNQNVLVPHVDERDLESLQAESLLESYSPDPGPFTRGVVTCTGSEFCTYGVIETKNRAIRWARRLDEWAADRDIDEEHDVIRLHMSGCSASCAQPQIADIGLRGEVYRDDLQTTEAVDVGLGGDLGSEAFIDWVAGRVPVETIPAAVERLVLAYSESRDPDEQFSDWTERVPDTTLRTILSETVDPTEVATETGVS